MKIVGGGFNAELGPGDGIERVSVGPRKGAEKQLDSILVDRKHIYCSRDAEANDMIHMGSDHRSVIAQFCHHSTHERNLTKNTL